VTAGIGAHFYSFHVHRKVAERHITHLDHESGLASPRRLVKCDSATECGFKCATRSPRDVIQHKRFEERIDMAARTVRRMFRYDPSFKAAARSSALKKSTPNPETGKAVDLPPPGGPATMNIRGATYPPKSRSTPSLMSVGRSVCTRFPSASAIPRRSNSSAAALTRSPAACKCGSAFGRVSFVV